MAFEDFLNDYTEVDVPADRIERTTTKVTVTDIDRDEEAYVYKDFLAGHFSGDFTHLFEITADQASVNALAWWYMLSNILDDGYEITFTDTVGYDAIGLYKFTNDRIYLTLVEDGTDTFSASYTFTEGTKYYITLDRDDDGGANNTGQYNCYIRTGSHSGNLEDTLTLDCAAGEQNDFQYCYGFTATNSANAGQSVDIIIENLDLQEAAPPEGAPGAMSLNRGYWGPTI